MQSARVWNFVVRNGKIDDVMKELVATADNEC